MSPQHGIGAQPARFAHRSAAGAAAALVLTCFVVTAHADELKNAVHWNAELCGGSYYTMSATANDPWSGYYATQRDQAKGAWAGAEWMILREGVWDKTLNFSSTCSSSWSSNWFDGTEQSSNGWYETNATIANWCSTGDVGCTGYDWEFPGYSLILAADTTVSRDEGWGVINQDTVGDYLENEAFSNCESFENTWLHELGHAYGLDHTSAQISTMGNGSFCTKNINIPQTYNDQFWPLDNAQMRSRYEIAAGSSTRRNFSVSAFRRDAFGTDSIDAPSARFLTTGAPSTTFTSVQYSLNRYFAASTGSVRVQFRFVPDGVTPTFNWSTLTWPWPSGTSTDTTDVHTSASGTVDTAVTRSLNITVTRGDLPGATGTWYRMWMLVDDTSAWSETEEGDNMVPTRYYVVKS